MANLQDGQVLNEHITATLNDLIIKSGKQIDRNEKVIWDDFLHQLNNDEWESMFMAFKELVAKHNLFLTHHQQRKFDEAYTTFQKDKHKREKCMDILNRAMNTRTLAWSMIMVIREIVNQSQGRVVDNVDAVKAEKPVAKEGRRKINIVATIEIWEELFEVK